MPNAGSGDLCGYTDCPAMVRSITSRSDSSLCSLYQKLSTSALRQ